MSLRGPQHHHAVHRRAVPALGEEHGVAQDVVLPLFKVFEGSWPKCAPGSASWWTRCNSKCPSRRRTSRGTSPHLVMRWGRHLINKERHWRNSVYSGSRAPRGLSSPGPPADQRYSSSPVTSVDRNWLEPQEIAEPECWEPEKDLIQYLEILFNPNDFVGYVTRFRPGG
mgnify:CR=1 FL=1